MEVAPSTDAPGRKDSSRMSLSIVYVGEPAGFGSFLSSLPLCGLSSGDELAVVCGHPLPMQELPDAIAGKVRMIPTPATPGLEGLAIAAAQACDSQFLVLASGMATLSQISQAIVDMETQAASLVSLPQKNAIIVRRMALLQTGELRKLVNPPASSESRIWDTNDLFREGFGYVLQVPDRVAMLGLLPKNGMVAEIGVFKGEFSAQILRVAQPAKLHLVDAWPDQVIRSDGEYISGADAGMFVAERFGDELDAGKVTLHRALSAPAAARFPDSHFDWIYIDAGHDYRSVKADLAAWYPKVKPGGFITGHDFIQKPGYGVVTAALEILRSQPLAFVALTSEPHGSRSWVLKKLNAGA
jgi:hypothetical protein